MELFVLLSVIWTVVHPQTFPYVSYMGETLANHGYVNLSLLEDDGIHNFRCHTDLAVCCSNVQGPHRGDWYFPDGNRLPFSGVISEARGDRVVDLVPGSGSLQSGVYCCYIPTGAVHDDKDDLVRDVVYVGLYSEGGNIAIIGNMTVHEDSDIVGATPQFTLTCISTGGPSTTVTWTRDSSTVTEGVESVLNDPETAQYTHTLSQWVDTRLGGLYKCTVANNKPSEAATEKQVQVASNISLISSPESSILVGNTVTLTCSVILAPGSYDDPEFSWQGPGLGVASPSGGAFSSVLTLSHITISEAGEYTCTASLDLSISVSTCVTVQIPAPVPHITPNVSGVLYAGIALTLTCSYSGLSDLVDTDIQINVTWRVNGSDVAMYPSYNADNFILTLSPLKTSHSGRYACLLMVITPQNHVHVQKPVHIAEQEILVKIPKPTVTFTVTHGPPIYAGTGVTFTCMVTLDSAVDNNESISIEFSGFNHLPENRLYFNPVTSLPMSKFVRNVTISPVADRDPGVYTCIGTVNGGSTASSSKDVSLLVTSLPAPNISLSSSNHSLVIGEPYSLICSVSVVPGFIGETSIEWTRQDGKVVNATIGNELRMFFNPLSVSNSSVYSCKGSLAFNGVVAVAAEVSNEILLAAPSGAPQAFKATAGQREVVFSWSSPPLAELNGVITNYTLFCNPAPTTSPLPASLSSPLSVAGFTPNTTYICSVMANNGLGSGPPSNTTITTQQDYLYFQVRLNGKVLCSQFIVTSTSDKLKDISMQLVRYLMESCVECDKEIIHQPFFVCYSESPTYVTYRATLKGTAKMDSESLLSLLRVWASKRDSIIVSGILMTVDPECMVAIHSLSEEECFMLSPTPQVTTTTTAHTTTGVSNTPIIVAGVLVPVIAIILLTIATSIPVIVFLKRNRQDISHTVTSPVRKERSESVSTNDNTAYNSMISICEGDGHVYEVVGKALSCPTSVNENALQLYDIPAPTVRSDQ